MALLQFAAVTALGLAVAWLAHRYFDLVGYSWTMTFAALGVMFLIGFAVDRAAARKRGQSVREYWRGSPPRD